jgi:dTDP-4-dehydrorhamnose 3,5-epimerase
MNVIKTPLEGLVVIEPKVYGDDRGYFFEAYNMLSMENTAHYTTPFVQDNQSRSIKNVLRGLHYQNHPTPQAKLIRCLEGRIWDVAVDIRKSSPTYKQWFGIELTAENKKQLLIPHGFAHGFAVLSDTAEVFYKCDTYYNKAAEAGVYFNDPEIGIDWKMNVADAIVSEKDAKQPMLKDAVNLYE